MQKLLKKNIHCGLGTDVAGGYSPSMLVAQRNAVTASFSHAINTGTSRDRKSILTYKEAFYLATLGGAIALDLDSIIGSLTVGKSFDALILDADAVNIDIFPTDGVEDRLQKEALT